MPCAVGMREWENNILLIKNKFSCAGVAESVKKMFFIYILY